MVGYSERGIVPGKWGFIPLTIVEIAGTASTVPVGGQFDESPYLVQNVDSLLTRHPRFAQRTRPFEPFIVGIR